MKIILDQHGTTAVKLKNDKFNIISDRPLETGGSGLGILGGQYMLIGIGGCFCSNVFEAAKVRDVKIEGLQVKVSTTFTKDKPIRFETVTLDISYKYVSDEKMAEKIFKIAEKSCKAINSAKIGMSVEVKFQK